MKNILLYIVLLISAFNVSAQSNVKKLEKKYLLVKELFNSGQLESAAAEGEKGLMSFSGKHSGSYFYFQILKYTAESYYYDFKFAAFEETVKRGIVENEALAADKRLAGSLAIAGLYNFSGQPAMAAKFVNENAQTITSNILKEDLLVEKSLTLKNQGFLNNSLEILKSQKEKRKNILAKIDTANAYTSSVKVNLNEHREKFAIVLLHIADVLFLKKEFTEAELNLKDAIVFIKTELTGNAVLLAQCYKLKAQICSEKLEYSAASAFYRQALVLLASSDKIPGKAEIVKEKLYSDLLLGRKVESENEFRKLQMLGKQTGRNDFSESYYSLSVIDKFILEGNSEDAFKRLKELQLQCKQVPEYSSLYLECLNTESEIQKGRLNLEEHFRILNDRDKLIEKYYGKNSPVLHTYKLKKAIALMELRGITPEVDAILSESLAPGTSQAGRAEAEKFYLLAGEYFLQKDKADSINFYLTRIRLNRQELTLENVRNNVRKVLLLYQAGNLKDADVLLSELEKIVYDDKLNNDFETLLALVEIYELTGKVTKSQALKTKFQKLSKEKHFYNDLLGELKSYYVLSGIFSQSGNFYKATGFINDAYQQTEVKLAGTPLLLKILLRNCEIEIAGGNYAQADKLAEKALQLAEKLYGKNSVYYNEARLVQARYYFAIADFQQAIEVCKPISQPAEKGKISNPSLRINSVLLQAECSRNIRNQFKAAELGYKQALQLVSESYGDTSEYFITTSLKFSSYLIESGKTDDAKKLADKIEIVFKKDGGKSRPLQFLASQNLQGEIAYEQKQYQKSVNIWNDVLEKFKRLFSETHPDYIKTKARLARAYFMLRDFEKSYNIMQEVLNQYDLYISELFPVMSFGQKSALWNSFKDEYEFYNFLVLQQMYAQKPALAGNVFNNVIATKAILLTSDLKLRDRINNSGDSLLINLYEAWVQQKELLASAFALSKEEMQFDQIDIKTLELEIAHLEKEMSIRSELFAEDEKHVKINWQEIKKSLAPGEAAIEMVRIRTFNHRLSDSAFYAALILSEKNTAGPDLVILSNAKDLDGKFYKYFRNATVLKLQDENSYKNYWEPLALKLPEKSHIYFSPDGIYYQINPETFRMADGKSLVETNTISFVSNTKDLVSTDKSEKKNSNKVVNKSFFLGANPDFYIAKTSGNIAQLPGADMEVKDISEELKKTNVSPVVITGAALTEDTLKALSDMHVLHIATHGYFMETKYDETRNFISNPLLNSGILLAGAGDIIDGINPNSKDGILTAFEAVSLKMDKTELVVLSACETGRGEVKNGEGVFGLQRSFLIAGADAVIISLFKVNDDVTRKFMKIFYEEWMKSGNKRNAFNTAKLKIKQEFPEPIYWGAFVMVEKKPKAESSVFVK